MTNFKKLDKVAISIRAFKILNQLLTENNRLKRIIQNSESDTDVLIEMKKWALENLSRNPDALDYIFKGETMMLLDEIYGENGRAIAFNMAKKGIDGGLYQVLKSLGSHYTQKRVKARIQGAVIGFLGGYDYEGLQALSEEYIARFGHILPSEMKEKGGYWLIKNFEHVLCQHPHIIKQFRETNK